MNDGFVLAHLSDTHLDGHERSAARAQQVMDYLHGMARPVDAIVVTGDITDHGLPEEHEQAAKIFSSHLPVLTCPGNHDGYHRYDWPRNQAHDLGPVTLVLLDSVILGRDDGGLADQTLEFCATILASRSPGHPVLLAMHHPPVVVHHELIDDIGLDQKSRDGLAELVTRHPNVAAILCGHAHSAAASTFAGRPVLVAPGVTSTLLLPGEGGSLDYGQPPGLALHILGESGHMTTHFRFLPD